jgi:DNA-binding LacI/PurR family transcriptional regulator
MPTIKDVAKEAGVSIATVSYVLNDRKDMVSDKTRLHVLEIAKRLGYRPNIIARNLQSSRTKLVGYAWHINPLDQPTSVMDQFIYTLAQTVEEAGYHLLTFTNKSEDPVAVYEDLISSGRVDGFVVADTVSDDPRVRFLIEQNFPFVAFGRANDAWDFDWVDTDGEAGMAEATRYLTSIGHQRIAFLGWPQDSLSGNHRLQGFLDVMQEAGLAIPEHFIIHNEYANNSLGQAFELWQSLPANQRPTALLCVSDFVAVNAKQMAEQFGYRVGENLSIVGFDDAPFVRYLQPGLSTMSQPFGYICDLLVQRLDSIICDDGAGRLQKLIVPKLVIRGSSAAPQAER